MTTASRELEVSLARRWGVVAGMDEVGRGALAGPVAVGVALSQHVLEGAGAWRLQGGGFAGTIQAFVPADRLERYIATMESAFGKGSCYVLSVRNYGAIRVEEKL